MPGLHRGDEGEHLTPIGDILSTFDDDQADAQGQAWERQAKVVGRAVAAHYRSLIAQGMPERTARKLTRDFQGNLLFEKLGSEFSGALFVEDDD